MARIGKQPKNWTNEELIGWANGDNTPSKDVTDEALASEAFARMEMAEGTVEEAKQALVGAVEGTDEPTPEPETAPEPTPEPTPAPKTESPVKAKEEADVGLEMVREGLNEYLDIMKPGRSHVRGEGPAAQAKLYRTIKTVLRMDGSRFIRAFGELLKVVNENRKGAFDERYLFRYFDSLVLTSPERRNFERILNLLITTADPKTRTKAIEQVDIDATMEGFRDAEMHQRVIEFYRGM